MGNELLNCQQVEHISLPQKAMVVPSSNRRNNSIAKIINRRQQKCSSRQSSNASDLLETNSKPFSMIERESPAKQYKSRLVSQRKNTLSANQLIKKGRQVVKPEVLAQRKALSNVLISKLGLKLLLNEKGLALQSFEIQSKKLKMSDIICNICINNQEHLIEIINQIEDEYRTGQSQTSVDKQQNFNHQLYDFLTEVDKTQMDLLDLLYHKNEQIYEENIDKLTFKKDIDENLIRMNDVMAEEQQFRGSPQNRYERYKQIGLNLIRGGKVCFFVMAGGKSSRFTINSQRHKNTKNKHNTELKEQEESGQRVRQNRSKTKQFEPLNIPSGQGILEIIINRFLAITEKFDCQITLYMCVSPQKVDDLTEQVFTLTTESTKLTIYPFVHKMIGSLDFQGKIVTEDSNMPALWPVGSGDIWNVLMGDKFLKFPDINQLIDSGFEYVQVLGTANALEKCFDCFALGLAEQEQLDWTTKVVQSLVQQKYIKGSQKQMEQNVQPKIFINNSEQIYVTDPQQTDSYPESCRHTFINSSLFRLSYLKRALKSEEWLKMHPRKKINEFNRLPPISKHQTVISYQKDYTDIFRLAKPQLPTFQQECLSLAHSQQDTRYRIIVCDQSDYYPLVYSNHGHSDIEHASQAILDLHRKYLGVEGTSLRIQIDPHVSLQGQDLEQIKRDLSSELHSLDESEQIFIEKKE